MYKNISNVEKYLDEIIFLMISKCRFLVNNFQTIQFHCHVFCKQSSGASMEQTSIIEL